MSNGLVQPVVEYDRAIQVAHQGGYALGLADGLKKCAKLEAELAEAAELIAVQQHALAESAKALADNATNGRVLKTALRLACKYQFDRGLWFLPGSKMKLAENWREIKAMFITQAQKKP